MVKINLPFSPGDSFDTNDLKDYIQKFDRNYIIQGQQKCTLSHHTKPQSLDYWLRKNSHNPDTKQAVNEVIIDLVKTGEFKQGHFTCPDSGEDGVKGVQIKKVIGKIKFKSE